MKILAGFLLLYTVTAVPVIENSSRNEISVDAESSIDTLGNDLYVYDDNGKLVKLDLGEHYPDSDKDTEKDLQTRVLFYLYTKQTGDNPQQLQLNDVAGLKKSQFNARKETKFVTHGWMNSKKSKACTLVREAFLRNGDYNVIVVDWSSISKRPYLWASKRVLMVAQYVSKMIDFLVSQGMKTSQLTIVGHSLGGHIAGLSSYYAKSKAHYVVALDPALPNFYTSGQGTRVSKGDASYVQVIHTNAGGLGYKSSIGDADYFPNGGTKQNGCTNIDGGACSHSRSYFYYAESIDSKVGFAGRNCDNYDNYLNGKCKTNLLSLMGGLLPKFNIKGNFYLKTNNKSPFAMGNLVDY